MPLQMCRAIIIVLHNTLREPTALLSPSKNNVGGACDSHTAPQAELMQESALVEAGRSLT